MIADEKNNMLFPHKRLSHLHNFHYRDSGNGKISIKHARENDVDYSAINLQGGATSMNVTSTIVSDYDRQVARERSQKLKEEGLTIKERLAKIKKHMTATKLTIDGRHYHMDRTVYQRAKMRRDDDDDKLIEARRKEDYEYAIACYKADRARERNPSNGVKSWRRSNDIKDFLSPLKVKGKDPAWPGNRAEMEILFLQWSNRRRYQLVMEQCVMEKVNNWVRNQQTKDATQNQGKTK